MDTRKNLILVTLIIAFISLSTAVSWEKEGFNSENINYTYNETHITLYNSQIEKDIPLHNFLLPDTLHDDLRNPGGCASWMYCVGKNGNFRILTDPNSGENRFYTKIQYIIGFNRGSPFNDDPDGDIPETFGNFQENTRISLGYSRKNIDKPLMRRTSDRINLSVKAVNNHFILNYDFYSPQGNLVREYQDIYTDNQSGRIPFTAQVNKPEIDTYTQKITQDNRYGKKDERVLNIIKPEEAEIKTINWNGLNHSTCDLNYYEYSRPRLQQADINSSLILDDLYQKTYNCYNVTIPADSQPEIEVKFQYNHTETSEGEFRVRKTPEFYTYIIGSGGAMKTTGSRELCGELTNEQGNYYDNILIEGTIELTCDSTIKANNIIEINGQINAEGQNGEDQPDGTDQPGEDGENSHNLVLEANRIEQYGIINLEGGNGGDGSSNQGGGEGGTRGGDAGNGGNLTVNSFRYILKDYIWLEGGNGGDGGSGADTVNPGRGGHGGIGGSIDINTQYFKTQGFAEFETFGGNGGEGGYSVNPPDSNNPGGKAGETGTIQINAYKSIVNGLNVEGNGGDGGKAGENTGEPGQDGSQGTQFEITSTILNITDSTIKLDGGNGGFTEDNTAGKGGKAGNVYLDYEKFKVENTDIYARGGDGGDARQYDTFDAQAGAGGDGGTIRTRTYHQTITDNLFNVSGGDGGDGTERNDGSADGGDGGEGGTIKVIYRDTITNAFNNFIAYGGLGGEGDDDGGNPVHGTDGSDGTIDITQDSSLSLNTKSTDTELQWNNYLIYSQNGQYLGEIPQRRNITVRANFTIDTEIPGVAELSIYDRTDNATVYQQSMTQISKKEDNGEYTYVFEYDYNIPQRSESGGEWFTEIRVDDGFGNNYTNSKYFTYQYKERNIQNAIQGEARTGQPIRFDQDITVSNPSGTSYSNPVLIRFPLIDSVVLEDTEIRDSSGQAVESNTFTRNGQNYVQWNATGLSGSKTFGVVWYMEPIIIEEQSGVDETSTGKKVANQDFTFKNPSNDTALTDVQLQAGFLQPERTVEAQLFKEDGTEITNSETLGTYFSDEDLDGFTDTANWEIDSLIPGNPKKYSLVTDLGKPIQVYREPVITNRPVEPGKPIKWRIGFAFQNDNNFNVPYNYRMRIPLDASNIRLQGQLKDQRFDNLGPYVLFERNLDSNSNSTAFLRYETRSISAPPIQTNRADRNFVGEGAEVQKTVVIENLVDQKIQNVRRSLDIDYGEDLTVVDADEEKELATQSTVRDGYTIKVPELEANEDKEIQVGYRVPIGEKELVREGQAEGYQLKVWEVRSTTENPVDNVYFRTKDIDCSEVHEVRVVSNENQNIQDGTLVNDWECGSTIVPLDTLTAGETVRIGITYKKTDTEIQTNPLTNIAVGAGKWIVIFGSIILLFEISTRLIEKMNIQPPWRNKNGR
jgi:hypothetical protein